jgi:hypothetical protein
VVRRSTLRHWHVSQLAAKSAYLKVTGRSRLFQRSSRCSHTLLHKPAAQPASLHSHGMKQISLAREPRKRPAAHNAAK